jgi:hypothetical protein
MDNPGRVNLVGAVHQGTAQQWLDNEQKRFFFPCGSVSFFLSDKEQLAESFYYAAASSFNKSF